MAPIYVAMYMHGKGTDLREKVQEKLLPDIEIVHVCHSFEAAMTEIPALCAGDTSVAPSSGSGTNATSAEKQVPAFVFFGGGSLPDEEYDKIVTAVSAKAPGVQFVKCGKRDVVMAGGFGPNPDVIAKVYRKKVAKLQEA